MKAELRNISKSYGDKQVLSDITMTFEEGITCIMGPSGRGKTTLAYIIAGLITPDSGVVAGCGRTDENRPAEADDKKISFMFQEDRLLEWETALKNVLFVTNSARRAAAVKLLTQAGLADSMDKKASKLSGGMKRRVALCRALIADCDILILDEPFKGLDSGIKPSIMDMVKEHSAGKITICITHDPTEAVFLSGRVVEL